MKMFLLLTLFTLSIINIVSAQKAPKDFEISFIFGYHKEDATHFDSKKKTLIVQGIDTVMTFKLVLTDQEKQSIYIEIQKCNFYNLPEKYLYQYSDTEEVFHYPPCRHFFLTVIDKKNSKKVEWDTCIGARTKDETYEALMNLEKVIEKIIWSGNPLKDYHPSKMRTDPN